VKEMKKKKLMDGKKLKVRKVVSNKKVKVNKKVKDYKKNKLGEEIKLSERSELRKRVKLGKRNKKVNGGYGGKKLVIFEKNNKGLIIFLVKFFVIFFAFSYFIETIDTSFLQNFITFISASYLGLTFFENTVFMGTQTFVVTEFCTGLLSAGILATIIFSLKKPVLLNKVILFVFGTVLLLLINIPRIMLVLISAKFGLDAELVHTFTWFIMSAVIIAIWYYGMKSFGIKNFNELL
jgi:exosortase/archaeosortase family protein